jgi:hypothetical protein
LRAKSWRSSEKVPGKKVPEDRILDFNTVLLFAGLLWDW